MQYISRVVRLLLFYQIASSGSVSAQVNGKADTIRLATYTYFVNNRIANLQPLADYLTGRTGYSVIAVSYPTVQRLIEAIQHDSVDFAMMNTSGYLVLQRKSPGVISPLVTLEMGMGQVTNYGGCIIASRQSGITSISQLKRDQRKLTMALVSSSSTSGNLVPRLLLNAEDIRNAEEKFNLYYAGTHRKTVEEVLNGKADLAGCGCAEIDSARVKGQFDDKAVMIAAFNDTPLGPIVYNNRLSKKLVDLIHKDLLQLHLTRKIVFENFCAGWTEFKGASCFKSVSDSYYDAFRKMIGDNDSIWNLIE